jgi:hypothetical protein
MANKARHAHGKSENIQNALNQGIIDAYDILFLDGDTDEPKIGWVTKDGEIVIVKNEQADLKELEAEVSALEASVETKANAEEVEAKINEAVADVLTETQTYVDEQIAKSESTIEIVEF